MPRRCAVNGRKEFPDERFDNPEKCEKVMALGDSGDQPGWRVTALQKTLNKVASLL